MSQAAISFPHPLLGCVDEMTSALDSVSGVDPAYLTLPARREALLGLCLIAERVAGLRLAVLADADDVAREDGARSVASWIASQMRTDPRTSHLDTELAQRLAGSCSATGAALRAGQVNTAQAASSARSRHSRTGSVARSSPLRRRS